MIHTKAEQKTANSGRFSEDVERQMAQSGIGFDGRFYRYKQYRYDLLADAVRYAQLDASRQTSRTEPDVSLQWAQVAQPTETEWKTMSDLGIRFDGKSYRYGEYRYENFVDAINYAKK